MISPLPINYGNGTNSRGGKQKKTTEKTNLPVPFPQILPCKCGAQRLFEFQLMPSMLHVLDVDSNANYLGDVSLDVLELVSTGGMNWGSVAIYSCPESCDLSREEFVIVQESIDEDPVTLKCGKNGNVYSNADDDDGENADNDYDS